MQPGEALQPLDGGDRILIEPQGAQVGQRAQDRRLHCSEPVAGEVEVRELRAWLYPSHGRQLHFCHAQTLQLAHARQTDWLRDNLHMQLKFLQIGIVGQAGSIRQGVHEQLQFGHACTTPHKLLLFNAVGLFASRQVPERPVQQGEAVAGDDAHAVGGRSPAATPRHQPFDCFAGRLHCEECAPIFSNALFSAPHFGWHALAHTHTLRTRRRIM